jgi:hypothetical protein
MRKNGRKSESLEPFAMEAGKNEKQGGKEERNKPYL